MSPVTSGFHTLEPAAALALHDPDGVSAARQALRALECEHSALAFVLDWVVEFLDCEREPIELKAVEGVSASGEAEAHRPRLGRERETTDNTWEVCVAEKRSETRECPFCREEVKAEAPPEAERSMEAYVQATERGGDLPLYDREARERALEQGRFS